MRTRRISIVHGLPVLILAALFIVAPSGWSFADSGAATNQKLTGKVIGTPGQWQGDPQYDITKAFDGDTNTFVNSAESTNGNSCWVGLDLGAPKVISKIRFVPRSDFPDRMTGGKFQGSATPDFAKPVDLFTIVDQPKVGEFTQAATLLSKDAFQYVRYLSPDDGWNNVAEIEFYSQASPGAATPSTGSRNKLTGKVIGTPGMYSNDPQYALEKAFDCDPTTFVNSPESTDGNGCWVGLDLGIPKTIAKIRFIPRSDFPDRMVGGKFQGCATPDFSKSVDLFVLTAQPKIDGFTDVTTLLSKDAFQYVRYLSPDGGWNNIAELEFYSN